MKTFMVVNKTVEFLQELLQNVGVVPPNEAWVLQVVCCGSLPTKVAPLPNNMACWSGESAGTDLWPVRSFVAGLWMVSRMESLMKSMLQILNNRNQ